jgi:hypothetical protein
VQGVGLDWAEDHHDVALGVPGKAVIEQFRIEHGPGRRGRSGRSLSGPGAGHGRGAGGAGYPAQAAVRASPHDMQSQIR